VKRAITFSTPLVPHNAAHWARANVDRVMLSGVTSTAQTGIYGMAATYVGIANMATEAFRLVNNPRFFDLIAHDDPPRRSQLTSVLPVSMAGLAAISVTMSLLSKDIFRWFLAPDYWEAYRYVPLLMVSGLVFAIYINIVNVLFHANRTGLIGLATVVGSAIGVLASALLIDRYGAWGSALGILVVNVAITAFVAVFAYRVNRIAWPWLPSLVCVVTPLLCYVGGMMTVWSLPLRAFASLAVCGLLAVMALPYVRALLANSVEAQS
jgi:O-antigen/teichoic acid export membrane protein